MWNMEYEIWKWNMEYGYGYEIWNMKYGIWNMKYGIWNMEYGIRNAGYRIWNMGYGIRDAEKGVWNMEMTKRKLKNLINFQVSRVIKSIFLSLPTVHLKSSQQFRKFHLLTTSYSHF